MPIEKICPTLKELKKSRVAYRKFWKKRNKNNPYFLLSKKTKKLWSDCWQKHWKSKNRKDKI